MSDWRWGFACVSHEATGAKIYSDPDRGGSKDDVIRLWRQREHLLALDQEFWPQDYYVLISFLHAHGGCRLALSGPNDEIEPLPAAGDDAALSLQPAMPAGAQEFGEPVPGQFVDTDRRRGLVWMGEEQILRAIGATGQGFRVRSVFVAPEREAFGIVVTHVNLPEVEDFAQPTRLRARWEWDDVQVYAPEGIRGPSELCVVPRLLIEQIGG